MKLKIPKISFFSKRVVLVASVLVIAVLGLVGKQIISDAANCSTTGVIGSASIPFSVSSSEAGTYKTWVEVQAAPNSVVAVEINGNCYRQTLASANASRPTWFAMNKPVESLKASTQYSMKFISYSKDLTLTNIQLTTDDTCNPGSDGNGCNSITSTPNPAPTPVGPSGYTKCADEGGKCSFSGTKKIAFGSNGKFVEKDVTSTIDCTIAAFGSDPVSGQTKACYVGPDVTTTPVNTNPTPSGLTNACTGTNVALSKTASSSSNELSTLAASRAFDGLKTVKSVQDGSRWSSAFSSPQWLQVDLGASYKINCVYIDWDYASGRDYDVQISTNGTTWTTVKTVGGSKTYGIANFPNFNTTARYVRIYGKVSNTQWGYSIWELGVYGTQENTTPTPTPTPTPTTDKTPPSQPSSLVWNPYRSFFTNNIKLTWKPSTDNIGVTKYEVSVDGKAPFSVIPTKPEVIMSSVVNNKTYNVTVKAVDKAGNKSSAASISMTPKCSWYGCRK
ncbi:discoidin domain-containing protein [Candidatus Saccharibacteria bacterium]|nr:discoidin domain-containing protein [Candidatus Saccharibacteria bacterium]